jgi:hypothetical protein
MMRRRARNSTLVLGAFLLTFLLVPGGAPAKPSEKPFGIVPGSFHMVPSTVQAGAHEDLTTSFDFAHSAAGRTFNDPRNVIVNVPAGFTANNTAVPTCKDSQLLAINTSVEGLGGTPANSCPPASQVGTITLDLNFSTGSEVQRDTFPVYNMEVTSFGVTAELGFKAAYITQIMPVSVRPGDDGLTVTAPDIERIGDPNNISVTIWGLPAAKIHDPERGRECYPETTFLHVECKYGGEEVNIPVKPFLSMPTSCGSFTATMWANSWEAPGNGSEASDEIGPVAECERIHFDPAIETNLSTRSAESPTGLDVSLVVPQYWENSVAPASSNLKDASVALPEGVTINPSAGSGLGACTPQQYEAETSGSLPGEGCPPESKIGSIDIETPLLAEKIPGAIYIAKPFDNPFHSLLALYVLAKDPARGILVKVAGKIEPNPVTGQLVTTFDDNPQQPFNRFTLKFRPGATAPLVSPPACGTYTTRAQLTPWSAPGEPRLVSSTFETTQGVREGPCPSGGVPPFKPQVISGTQNNDGGSYSPFYLRILREDGEQELTKFTTVLPPGLTGNLSGIPFCPEAHIEAARHTSGTQQIEGPSCPAASEIGHTIVGAGVGTVLAQTPGKIYLAGPYHGSALSIVSVTSATVGPFDLGTVVIRFALRINPVTAQAEVDSASSDPIPHIIEGIVVHVREIRVYMDRPKFILNPTNCNPMQITDVITGAGADFTNPAAGDSVNVNTPFQAADCSSLAFKPTFKVSTSGRTSRKNGASLSVKLTYPKAPEGSQANIRSVKVDLPKQLPSRLTTLQKACPDSVFGANPAACPAASIVGYAQANTPILPVPIAGPAYFVSHGGAKFPELIIVLQGYGITIDLHGETFISKAGITSSTFRTVPDNPIGSFQLTLPQGSNSALAANGNLCTVKKLVMPTSFVAQNGAVIHANTPIVSTGCPKHVRHVRKKNLQKKK